MHRTALDAEAAGRGDFRGRLHTKLKIDHLRDFPSHAQVSSVIAGATQPEQIIANAKASEWRLTSEEMDELNAVLQALALLTHRVAALGRFDLHHVGSHIGQEHGAKGTRDNAR
jgi:hypothetical protein